MYQQPTIQPQAPALRKLCNSAGLTVLLLLLAQYALRLPLMLAQQLSYSLHGGGMGALPMQLGMVAIYTLSMVFAIWVGMHLFGIRPAFAIPMARVPGKYLYPAVWVGLGVTLLAGYLAFFLCWLLGLFGVYAASNPPQFSGGAASIAVTLLGTTLLPAVLEEVLFRGVLLQPLRHYGNRFAVVVSALLFALCHPTLPQFIVALVVGLCLGVFAVRTGSLLVGIVVHLVYNSFACISTLAVQYAPAMLASILGWPMVLVMLCGGMVGAVLLRRRFGNVLQLPPTPQGDSAYLVGSACTSVPLLAAVLLGTVIILRSVTIWG